MLKSEVKRHIIIGWSVLIIFIGLLLGGCVEGELDSPVPPSAGEVEAIYFTVNTPQSTIPTTLRRNLIDSETQIVDAIVLVFEYTNNNYIYKYFVCGSELSQDNSERTRFKVMLRATGKPVKLMLLANIGDAFELQAPDADVTEEYIKEQLTLSFNSAGWNKELPMYGEITLPDGIKVPQTQAYPVTLLRAVARVDVVTNLMDGTPDFMLEEVYAFRANNQIQLVPESFGSVSPPKVSAPSIPVDTELLEEPVVRVVQSDSESVEQLYLSESAAVTSNEEKQNQATTIVIGGRFNGDGKITYYRADFNSGVAGHPFGQILRNHRYIFNIRKVLSPGWGTPEEAADNLSASMQIEVHTWEDFSTEMYFGDHRFGISSREISLRYTKGCERKLDIESTLPYHIQWLDNITGEPVGESVSGFNATISNENFDATILKLIGDAEHISHLLFRTRNNNYAGGIVANKLRITAGNWSADITVTQDNTAMYGNRYIHVLSVEEIGHLGTTTTAASADALRAILDKQFVPDGTIKIGGFAFTRVANIEATVGTNVAANLAIMKRLIGAQDVIYFPYNIGISAEIADLLLEWLDNSPHRVLIVGADSNTTNMKLRARLTGDGTWEHSNIATVSNNYLRAPASIGSSNFFEGAFGTVSPTASFSRADGIAGYNNTYPRGTIIPLITGDKTGYTDYMFFGVNKERRIVYNGDAQLFQSGRMSNTQGNVNSDLDRLMANVWAWIVEQVIYGNI